jgi:hypothetical protein
MKKFLLDYISALLDDEFNSLKICIRDLDQRSNSIDMYQENSLPPTTKNIKINYRYSLFEIDDIIFINHE